jgi:hypothetical protein
VVVGDHYSVEAGVVEREGREVKVGGHKFDQLSIFFGLLRVPTSEMRIDSDSNLFSKVLRCDINIQRR